MEAGPVYYTLCRINKQISKTEQPSINRKIKKILNKGDLYAELKNMD
jgi:hypothetical protein